MRVQEKRENERKKRHHIYLHHSEQAEVVSPGEFICQDDMYSNEKSAHKGQKFTKRQEKFTLQCDETKPNCCKYYPYYGLLARQFPQENT